LGQRIQRIGRFVLVVGVDGGTFFLILFPFRTVADNQGQHKGWSGGSIVGLLLIPVTVQPGQEFLNFNEFDVVVLDDVVHGVASHGRRQGGIGGSSGGGVGGVI
jgi:hypothetical protein